VIAPLLVFPSSRFHQSREQARRAVLLTYCFGIAAIRRCISSGETSSMCVPSVHDGFYNNWWRYIVDYDNAVRDLPPPEGRLHKHAKAMY